MLVLNGKKLASNDREFTDSLFVRGGTCVGYYKVLKNEIKIMDIHKNKVGVITKNGVLAKASKLENGKYWYSYGDIDIIGEYSSYAQKTNEVNDVIKSFSF